MKIISFILACTLLLSGIFPCNGKFESQHVASNQEVSCHPSKDKHACCHAPAEEEQSSEQEHPCSDGCSCYCCVPLIAFDFSGIPSFFHQDEIEQQKNWKASIYSYEFTHLVWHPPKFS